MRRIRVAAMVSACALALVGCTSGAVSVGQVGTGSLNGGPVDTTADASSLVVRQAVSTAPADDPQLDEVPITVESGVLAEAAEATDDAAVQPSPPPSTSTAAAIDPSSSAKAVVDSVADGKAVSSTISTDGYQTVAIAWTADSDVTSVDAAIRTLSDGEWGEWTEIGAESASPDAGTADAAAQKRGGTESVWIGDVDAVQVGFDGGTTKVPDGASVVLVGSAPVPTVTPSSSTGEMVVKDAAWHGTAPTVSATSGLSAGLTSVPTIISREQWGAAPQVCQPDVASSLVGAVVHHTAGSNDYTSVAQAAQQIRNDQRYHIQTRGWCDIGYNFIVDKWGNIYEGRDNSLNQAVIGVHAGGFNTGTVGVSMLGSYDQPPSAATQEAVAHIIGWRLGDYGIDPMGQMSYYTATGENSRFSNQTVTLPRIFGHRDVAYTACPGAGGYAVLGAIRVMAATSASALQYSEAKAMVRAIYHDMLGRDVDPAGLSSWTAALLNGSSPDRVVASITVSREYVTARVVEAYSEVLGRRPDTTGLTNWTNLIMSGQLRAEDLRGQLIASNEYYGIAGGNDTAYVQRLYHDILGRDAGPAEVSYWLGQISARGRLAAPSGVWRSLESAHQRIHEAYYTYLDRPADPQGLSTWGPYWQVYGEDLLRTQITGSQEYLARSRAWMG